MFVDIVVGADRPGGNLQRASLENAFLPSVNLAGANLQRADGSGGNFRGTQLQGANMQQGIDEKADFTREPTFRMQTSSTPTSPAPLWPTPT